jgi:aryl-alcohol dehydrogenase-like predicted oxidoreductase
VPSQLSRLCLGTAQFMPGYGIASQHRVSASDTVNILRTAYELGVRHFDTSEDYADASLRCARYLPHSYWISTKLAPDLVEDGRVSRAHLGDPEAILLLHNPTVDQLSDHDVTQWVDGASVYTPDEALAAIRAGLNTIQVPYHALDQSHRRAGVFAAAKAADVTVMARQPWGQGLLTLETESATCIALGRSTLDRVTANRYAELLWEWRTVCGKHGLTPLEAGLRFSLESLADLVVFGVDTVEQLRQDVAIAESDPPTVWAACYQELLTTFADSALTLASVCTVR